jgi:hypothetical protein
MFFTTSDGHFWPAITEAASPSTAFARGTGGFFGRSLHAGGCHLWRLAAMKELGREGYD